MSNEIEEVGMVRVNINAEVMKMAAADGVKAVQVLDRPVTMPLRDYYKASVLSYYRGRQDGYNETNNLSGVEIKAALRRRFIQGVTAATAILVGVAGIVVISLR